MLIHHVVPCAISSFHPAYQGNLSHAVWLVGIIKVETQHAFVCVSHHGLIKIGWLQVWIAPGVMIDVVAKGIRIHVDDVRPGNTTAEIPVEGMVPMGLITDTERREEPAVFCMMGDVIYFRQPVPFRPGILITSAEIERQLVSPLSAILCIR